MTAATVVGGEVTTNTARSGTSFAMNLPAAVTSDGSGDLLVALITNEAGGTAIVPGGSWVAIYEQQWDTIRIGGFYKVATGSEGATESITVPNDHTVSICYRITGQGATAPEASVFGVGFNRDLYFDSLIPSAKVPDDYLILSVGHTSTDSPVTTWPHASNRLHTGSSCSVMACSDTAAGTYAIDRGDYYRIDIETVRVAATARVAIYPATSYTHPADDFPHVESIETTTESSLSGTTLALNLPAGIQSGELLFAVITQEVVLTSDLGNIEWPAGWTELYQRTHFDGSFLGSAAFKIADGTEGATVNMTALEALDLSAFVWRISQAAGVRIDYRFKESIASPTSYEFSTVTPLGGQDNFLFIAAVHTYDDNHLLNSADSDYKNRARLDSAGGLVSTIFADRSANATSEVHADFTAYNEQQYISTMFAIQSNSQAAGNVRTTQAVVQYLFENANDARVTQTVAQYLFQQSTSARITQLALQSLVAAIPCVRRRCQVWKITRRDGTEYHYTTHDEPVTFHGDTYQPCNSLRASAAEAGTLNAVGGGDIQIAGLIASDEITERDLANGLFDGAQVEVWEVPWNDSTLASDAPKRLLKGAIGETTQGPTSYQAEVFTRSAKLAQNPLLDTFTPACRFKPGDGRCPIDVAALTTTGTVLDTVTRIARDRRAHRQFYTSAPGAYGSSSSSSGEPAVPWDYGLLTWLTGDNQGIEAEIKSIDSDSLMTLWDSMPNEIQIGDTFSVKPGCARTKEAHVTTWGFDIESFGGFPDIPGVDSIIRGPRR